jgi:hypothetical protein
LKAALAAIKFDGGDVAANMLLAFVSGLATAREACRACGHRISVSRRIFWVAFRGPSL